MIAVLGAGVWGLTIARLLIKNNHKVVVWSHSEEEVNNFVKQAEKFADEDKKTKERIEAKNEADTVLYTTEKALKDHGDKIGQDERLKIDKALSELKEAVKTVDVERIKRAKDEALTASQKLGEIIYKEAQAKANPQANAGAAGAQAQANPQVEPKKDDVVEAEVVDGK